MYMYILKSTIHTLCLSQLYVPRVLMQNFGLMVIGNKYKYILNLLLPKHNHINIVIITDHVLKVSYYIAEITITGRVFTEELANQKSLQIKIVKIQL